MLPLYYLHWSIFTVVTLSPPSLSKKQAFTYHIVPITNNIKAMVIFIFITVTSTFLSPASINHNFLAITFLILWDGINEIPHYSLYLHTVHARLYILITVCNMSNYASHDNMSLIRIWMLATMEMGLAPSTKAALWNLDCRNSTQHEATD